MLELNFEPFPTIMTERLVLREMVETDINEFFAIRSNKEVMERINKERVKTLEEAKVLMDKIANDIKLSNGIIWSVCLKDGKQIGNISFHKIYKEHHRAELGYALLPEFHLRGIMYEAVKAVIHYGFNSMKLHTIEARINPSNAASKRILEKNGFKQEGLLKESFLFRTKFFDTAVYSLLNPNASH